MDPMPSAVTGGHSCGVFREAEGDNGTLIVAGGRTDVGVSAMKISVRGMFCSIYYYSVGHNYEDSFEDNINPMLVDRT